ncbi:hypothetical protein HYW21_03780 [Candidatus Woesearchaeota archaeon]|nr:hypothetical protein [Candidatus Woesearchaeota archaeon]
METIIHLHEAWRMFQRSRDVAQRGMTSFQGSAESICKQIIEACWDEQQQYFKVSATGHFQEFYTRDFGWCVDALHALGYTSEVRKTLRYALTRFTHANRITVAITPRGKPFDFPEFAPDSLAYLLRCLRVLQDIDLMKAHQSLINAEIQRYYQKVIDPTTGLVRRDRTFSAMKDHALRQGSCYNTCMVGMLSKEINALNELLKKKVFVNPFEQYDYVSILKKYYWTGSFFRDDCSDNLYVASDAQLFPFWAEIIEDKTMLTSCMYAIQREKLDQPVPLKYTAQHQGTLRWYNYLASGYQANSIWSMLGMMYCQILAKIDKEKAQEHLLQYEQLITKHHNFLEVYNHDGNPFRRFFYATDESMLWCSMWLDLTRKLT